MPTAASPAPTDTIAPVVSVLTPAVFVALSSGLTGVSAALLKPAFDPIDAAGRFYATIRARVPAPVLDHMAGIFLAAPTAAEGAAAVLDDPELGAIGRSILKLWLLGAWHDPATPTISVEILPFPAYQQSLVRRTMQSSRPAVYSR